jgi:hypothetical protein
MYEIIGSYTTQAKFLEIVEKEKLAGNKVETFHAIVRTTVWVEENVAK